MSSFSDSGEVPVVSPAQMMPVQVLRREVIAPDTVTLYLVLPDTEQAPAPYLPGQFVTLALPTSELSSQFIAPVLSAPKIWPKRAGRWGECRRHHGERRGYNPRDE